jgi:hypothetical protein
MVGEQSLNKTGDSLLEGLCVRVGHGDAFVKLAIRIGLRLVRHSKQ